MDRKINGFEKPIDVKEDDEDRNTGRCIARQYKYERKGSPRERAGKDLKKAMHENDGVGVSI